MSPHTGASRHLANTPTGSHPQEPGPYHKANAMLRRQLPHYNVDVTVRTRWDHIVLWLIAVIIWFVYVGVRVIYLIRGRTGSLSASVKCPAMNDDRGPCAVEITNKSLFQNSNTIAQDSCRKWAFRGVKSSGVTRTLIAGALGTQDTSVWYSIVVLCGESALGMLGFYGQQMFWKQNLKYTRMDHEALQRSSDVRSYLLNTAVHLHFSHSHQSVPRGTHAIDAAR